MNHSVDTEMLQHPLWKQRRLPQHEIRKSRVICFNVDGVFFLYNDTAAVESEYSNGLIFIDALPSQLASRAYDFRCS